MLIQKEKFCRTSKKIIRELRWFRSRRNRADRQNYDQIILLRKEISPAARTRTYEYHRNIAKFMTRSAQQTPMNYELNSGANKKKVSTWLQSARSGPSYPERGAFLCMRHLRHSRTLRSIFIAPLSSRTSSTPILSPSNSAALLHSHSFFSVSLYRLFTSYAQTRLMGGMGHACFSTCETNIFGKLTELPVAFFNATSR